MGRPKKHRPPLPTVWHVPDALWELIEPVLAESDPPSARGGRRRVHPRPILDAIIFRLRTGCQWNHLPRELPDDSTVHRAFQRWVRLGVLERIWAALAAECAELGGVDWRWQAPDAAMGKARFGGTWSGRTPPTAPSAA
jgi:putative transposase